MYNFKETQLERQRLFFRNLSQEEKIIYLYGVYPGLKSLEDLYLNLQDNENLGLQLKINGHKIGEIDCFADKFTSVPKDSHNVMKIYKGIGVNAELLEKVGFTGIEIPFEGRILRTTRQNWLEKGIRSPFQSDKVDSQIIYPLDKLYDDTVEGSFRYWSIKQRGEALKSIFGEL